MKNILLLICVQLSLNLLAQEEAFSVQISSDSILLGNSFEVKFTATNVKMTDFDAPNFADFDLVGGPNQSTSMSMMNGETSSTTSFSYILQAREVGTFFITPASANIEGEMRETQPIEINVLPNPDGIRQNSRLENNSFNFFRGTDDFFKREMPQQPQQEAKPKKKKRKVKTYKI